MRRPTDPRDAYRTWYELLRGRKPPLHDGVPQCGFYKMRLAKGGPMVPVAIFLRQVIDKETGELIEPEEIVCLVNGRPDDAQRTWNWCCKNPITEAEYRHHEKHGRWAEENAPQHPAANPYTPVDPLKLDPVF